MFKYLIEFLTFSLRKNVTCLKISHPFIVFFLKWGFLCCCSSRIIILLDVTFLLWINICLILKSFCLTLQWEWEWSPVIYYQENIKLKGWFEKKVTSSSLIICKWCRCFCVFFSWFSLPKCVCMDRKREKVNQKWIPAGKGECDKNVGITFVEGPLQKCYREN